MPDKVKKCDADTEDVMIPAVMVVITAEVLPRTKDYEVTRSIHNISC